jgi:uracil-DNA glycosylase
MDSVLHNISDKWLNIIYSGDAKKKLDTIFNQLKDVENVTPHKNDWFNWARHTQLEDIRVVVLGQDPYHKSGWAHGLSFSCLYKIPPSLRNIYKCLINTKCIEKIPTHGNLTTWASQGVLLLNSSLSTIIGTAGKHLKLWDGYTKLVIQNICKYHYDNDNQLIFLLWGNYAHKFIKIIDADYHICLTSVHPSPLAQHTSEEKKFINCDHFTYINTHLKNEGEPQINWTPPHIEEKTTSKKKARLKEHPKTNASIDMSNCAKKILDIQQLHHIAFTDGSCYPNNKNSNSRGGYASVFVSGSFDNMCIYGNLDITTTNASNIRAEGVAIIRVLELVNKCDKKWDKITIVTDCEFWIKMVELYMPRWTSESFKNKANPDLTKRLWCIYNEVSKKGPIRLMHMKSHGKDGWQNHADGTFERFCFDKNDYVDKMCSYARKELQPTQEVFKNITPK